MTDNMSYRMNGSSDVKMESGTEEPAGFWRRIQVNERTFNLSLLVVSLSIVLGKLCMNYGNVSHWRAGSQYALPSVSTFSRAYEKFGVQSMQGIPEFDIKQLSKASERFMNVSSQYEKAFANAVVSFSERYDWLIKAAISGLIMMSFTWFIIYKDSSIPGINPPSPFSPSKRRISENSRIQTNYLVGLLNGILIFIYMCL